MNQAKQGSLHLAKRQMLIGGELAASASAQAIKIWWRRVFEANIYGETKK